MEISYSSQNEFDKADLQDLFLSVQWSSGNYPDDLVVAMRNSHRVISAWEGDKLVGLINALSDGAMAAYFHYLLVRPEYQSRGIGKQLVEMMLGEYEEYARKVPIAYDGQLGFYERCGFEAGLGTTAMFRTYLTT
jgi:GNAT superfamily N-acetyltransferase